MLNFKLQVSHCGRTSPSHDSHLVLQDPKTPRPPGPHTNPVPDGDVRQALALRTCQQPASRRGERMADLVKEPLIKSGASRSGHEGSEQREQGESRGKQFAGYQIFNEVTTVFNVYVRRCQT